MPTNPTLPQELYGKQVLLKRVTLSDIENLYRVFSTKKAVKYLDIAPANSREDVMGWIRRSTNAPTAFHAAWSVFDRDGKTILGTITYQDREPWQDKVRINFALLPQY